MAKEPKRGWQAPNPQKYIVQMNRLTSNEFYLHPSGKQKPVLKNNTLDVCRGECVGIIGKEAFEVELLLQIMGCVRPYGSGSCKLVERGMMRKKRRVLPHVFFVGDSSMAVPNMNVLEYLMFATNHTGVPAKERQIYFLEAMLDGDCCSWCLAPVKALSAQERAVLSLLAASFSNALLLIFPYFYQETSRELRGMLGAIARRVSAKGAALVIGVCDASLVDDACTHAAFLLRGTLRERGTLEELKSRWDKRDYIITTDDPESVADQLCLWLPDAEVRLNRDAVEVYHRYDEDLSQQTVLAALGGLPFRDIRRSERTIVNAFTEAQNDLSN